MKTGLDFYDYLFIKNRSDQYLENKNSKKGH